jgi:TRAP-type C4-dicarboxylate transport system permease small subunit
MNSFKEVIYSICRGFNWVAVGALLAMLLTVCFNVLCRLFSWPLSGAPELIEYMEGILIAFALPYTQMKRGHISIDLVVQRLQQNKKVVVLSAGCILSLVIFSLTTWQMILYGLDSWHIGEVSPVMKIPSFLIIFGVTSCFFLLCLVLFIELIKQLINNGRKK